MVSSLSAMTSPFQIAFIASVLPSVGRYGRSPLRPPAPATDGDLWGIWTRKAPSKRLGGPSGPAPGYDGRSRRAGTLSAYQRGRATNSDPPSRLDPGRDDVPPEGDVPAWAVAQPLGDREVAHVGRRVLEVGRDEQGDREEHRDVLADDRAPHHGEERRHPHQPVGEHARDDDPEPGAGPALLPPGELGADDLVEEAGDVRAVVL